MKEKKQEKIDTNVWSEFSQHYEDDPDAIIKLRTEAQGRLVAFGITALVVVFAILVAIFYA